MIETIAQCVQLLQNGEVVALPTETVYGLAARIDQPKSIQRIFELKQRPTNHPLIVHVANREQLEACVQRISPIEELLISAFWPGPLTILFQKSSTISDSITGGSEWVAVRMPAHDDFREIIEKLKIPLAAPSANAYQQLSPTSAEMVKFYLPGIGENIFDGGKTNYGLESTIVRVIDDTIHILRKGAISKEEIQQCIPIVAIKKSDSSSAKVPGNVYKHYSPRTPLSLFEFSPPVFHHDTTIGIISSQIDHQSLTPHFHWLDFDHLTLTASTLFETIYQFDQKGLKQIYIQKFPARGIGATVNDRLIKACR